MSIPLTAGIVAAEIRQVMYDAAHKSERSMQSADYRLGVSDIGLCHEKTRRMILQMPPDEEEVHYLPSFIGTAIGDLLEREIVARRPGQWLVQQELLIPLPDVSERMTGRALPGHADLICPEWNLLLDAKAPANIPVIERMGVKQNYRFQRHLYAWGAINAGILTEQDCLVGNVFIDRSGEREQPHVDLEPFSMDVVTDAARWLDEVFYAVYNQEEAEKDPPIEFCAGWCQWYLSCRALDRKIEGGLITDEELLTAVKVYTEAHEEEKEAAKRKAAAKRTLLGITGSTGEHAVKWVHVNESVIPATVRSAYDRLSITRIRRRDTIA